MNQTFTIMKKTNLLFMLLLLAFTVAEAQTVNITFQVDMSNEANPNDVQVVIKNPWIWTTLTDQGDGIWSGTAEVDANGTYPYTFVNGGQDNWDEEESVPEECNFGTETAPERNVTVLEEDLVVDPVEFGACPEGTTDDRVNVTLQVDLNSVTVLDGGVWVFMDADWSEFYTMTDDDEDGIYSYTVKKTPDSTLTYRFSYQYGPDYYDFTEENVPEACADDGGFRNLVVPSHDISLDAVIYEECSVEPISVTLQVNLNHVTDFYEGGGVWVFFDADWSQYESMTDDDGDGIYSFTVERTSGSTLTYRFSYQNGPDAYYDFTEENVPDLCANDGGFREYTVPKSNVTLPAFVYGSCDNNPTPRVNITFQVDMSDEINPNDVQVVIKDPWIWTTLTDQGSGIWSATVEVDGNNTYPYTFVNGGQDNWDEEESVPEECNFGTESAPERNVSVAEEDLVVDAVSFGTCDVTSSLKNLQLYDVSIFPNPANDYLNISGSNEPIESIQIFDSSGKLVKSQIIGQATEATISLQDIEQGIYFVRIQFTSGATNSKVVID